MRLRLSRSSSFVLLGRRACAVGLGVPLAVVSAAWLAPSVVSACSCRAPPPPAEALAAADAVFEARPFSMSNDSQRARYVFEVDRVWKGDIGPRVEISTALHSASCGRSYRIGSRYVVYARKNASDTWTDGLCSRTRTSQSAAEDLQVLGRGRSPRDPAPAATPPGPAGPGPTEPPRIDTPALEPPPTSPSRRGCTVEKPHTSDGLAILLLCGLAVAIGRRRAVRSARATR